MLKKNKKSLIFIIIGVSVFLTIVFACFFWNLFNNLGISDLFSDLFLKLQLAPDISTNNKKINTLTETLNEKEFVLASDFFEFEFSKGYLLCDPYIGGQVLSEDYGWNVKESEVPYQSDGYTERIVFVDKNDKFIYLFNYTGAESYFVNKGIIIYPDTKIIKYKVKDDGITLLKFDSDDYYDEYCKSLTFY